MALFVNFLDDDVRQHNARGDERADRGPGPAGAGWRKVMTESCPRFELRHCLIVGGSRKPLRVVRMAVTSRPSDLEPTGNRRKPLNPQPNYTASDDLAQTACALSGPFVKLHSA